MPFIIDDREKESAVSLGEDSQSLPLCVDLDGTLVRSDTLVESIISNLSDWRVWHAALLFFTNGPAAMKREIAKIAPVDAASLPYSDTFVDYLRAEQACGRYIVLATAADHATAEAVNNHLRLFDVVLASDGTRNLKGPLKAQALINLFGDKGFIYAGNDHSDLAVWKHANSAIIVNANRALVAKAIVVSSIERLFDDRSSRLRAILKALRPYQWVKNLLVLVPVATAHALGDTEAWGKVAWTFAAFCVTASGIYVLNDLCDLRADRQHPRKRRRPFASGALSMPVGLGMAAGLLGAGVFFASHSSVLILIGLYAAMSLSYSLWLKEFPLVDVFILAGLYTLRLFAGGVATGHQVSLPLLGFSSFFFLSLALVKRVSEMMTLTQESAMRRGYLVRDAPMLQLMGIASGFTAIVVLALFVQNEAASLSYSLPFLLWCAVPLILFWLCRIWLSTARGYMHDDPIVYAAKDWVSWLVLLAVFSSLAAAKTFTINGCDGPC